MLGESCDYGCFDCFMGCPCPGFAREPTTTTKISKWDSEMVREVPEAISWDPVIVTSSSYVWK